MTALRWYWWKIPFLLYAKKHYLSFVIKPWSKIGARERHQIFELVCRVYRDEKAYADSSLTPDDVEDRYDARAVYALAYERSQLIGFARLVSDTGDGFQTANWLPLKFPAEVHTKHLAEISRFIVAPEYRGGRRFVTLGIIRALFRYGKRKGLTHFLAILPHALLGSFTRLGISHEVIQHGIPQKQHIEAQQAQKTLVHYLKKVDFRTVLFPVMYIP